MGFLVKVQWVELSVLLLGNIMFDINLIKTTSVL